MQDNVCADSVAQIHTYTYLLAGEETNNTDIRDQSYEARVGVCPGATWRSQEQWSCFRCYKAVSRTCRCCTPEAVIIKWGHRCLENKKTWSSVREAWKPFYNFRKRKLFILSQRNDSLSLHKCGPRMLHGNVYLVTASANGRTGIKFICVQTWRQECELFLCMVFCRPSFQEW